MTLSAKVTSTFFFWPSRRISSWTLSPTFSSSRAPKRSFWALMVFPLTPVMTSPRVSSPFACLRKAHHFEQRILVLVQRRRIDQHACQDPFFLSMEACCPLPSESNASYVRCDVDVHCMLVFSSETDAAQPIASLDLIRKTKTNHSLLSSWQAYEFC